MGKAPFFHGRPLTLAEKRQISETQKTKSKTNKQFDAAEFDREFISDTFKPLTAKGSRTLGTD